MTHVYEREIFIPFQLSDAAGIVFFGHVFSISHEVYEHFIQDKLNISWQHWFNNPDWIAPIKQSKAIYYAPLMAGQKYQVNLNIQLLTRSSFTLTYHFQKDQQEYCQVETLHVFCNRTNKIKQPIPSEIKEIFQKLKTADKWVQLKE